MYHLINRCYPDHDTVGNSDSGIGNTLYQRLLAASNAGRQPGESDAGFEKRDRTTRDRWYEMCVNEIGENNMTVSIATILENAVTVAQADISGAVLPLFSTLVNNIAANPTAVNALGQFTVFNAEVLALGPTVGQEVLQSVAKALIAAVTPAPAAPAA